jgi:hypothetical protein
MSCRPRPLMARPRWRRRRGSWLNLPLRTPRWCSGGGNFRRRRATSNPTITKNLMRKIKEDSNGKDPIVEATEKEAAAVGELVVVEERAEEVEEAEETPEEVEVIEVIEEKVEAEVAGETAGEAEEVEGIEEVEEKAEKAEKAERGQQRPPGPTTRTRATTSKTRLPKETELLRENVR